MKKIRKIGWVWAIWSAMLIAGCGMTASYRPAEIKTIQDFPVSAPYQKQIGVMALTSTATVLSDSVAVPFMESFLSEMTAAAADSLLVAPGKPNMPPFLLNPPRLASGEVDMFAFSALTRQAGMNVVASPVLMDVRAYKETHGFWFFRTVAHHLRIQAVAVVYDAITGSRLTLDLLAQEIPIDEQLSTIINGGQEAPVPGLSEAAGKMGKELGARMAETIYHTRWLSSVIAVENRMCIIPAGSGVGIAVGDRFSVLDASEVVAGWNEQRYRVPGLKIGEIRVIQVTPEQSFAVPETGSDLPPVGSIVVPGP